MKTPKYPQVTVQLTGADGNGAAIIGRVYKAIRREVGQAEADAFASEAIDSESYDALLVLVMETVDVE